MKKLTLKQCVVIVRVAALALVLVIISMFLFSFTVERKLADDIWKQLGIDKVAGTNNIKESFYHNYFYFYGAKNIKKIASGNRVAVARDLLTYTKQYVNGPEFKKAYDAYRNDSKPRAPELKTVRTKEQVQKDLVLFGGAEITASLIKLNLIDEYQVIVNPVVLGKGSPTFALDEKLNFKLVELKRFTCGNVIHYYHPAKK